MIFSRYIYKLHNLPKINNIEFLNSFDICEKNMNDKNNKIREQYQ